MSMTVQVIIATALSIIAIYFLVLTFLVIAAYRKFRVLENYVQYVLREKVDRSLDNLKSISQRVEEVADRTAGKVEELSDVLPELRDKLQELIDLLDLVQSKLKNPLLNLVSAVKVFSEKVHRWL